MASNTQLYEKTSNRTKYQFDLTLGFSIIISSIEATWWRWCKSVTKSEYNEIVIQYGALRAIFYTKATSTCVYRRIIAGKKNSSWFRQLFGTSFRVNQFCSHQPKHDHIKHIFDFTISITSIKKAVQKQPNQMTQPKKQKQKKFSNQKTILKLFNDQAAVKLLLFQTKKYIFT